MPPKFSIITITYNSEKTLEETIKSVVSQDYGNFEYIIVDGESKDKTLDIVNKYSDRISCVISEPDNGISDAFNKGIRQASGEIIGIINSDDFLCPNALNILASFYSEDIDVYRGDMIALDEDKGVKQKIIPTMKFLFNPFRKGPINHPSTFIRKTAYEKWGVYDESLKYTMDADLLFRFYKGGAKMKYIDKELAVFRIGGLTSDSYKKKTKEIYRLVRHNGGSPLQSLLYLAHFVVSQQLRSLITFLGIN